MTRRLPSHDEAALHRILLKRASHAAKNALITSAMAFGRHGGGEREVLFAVAQTFTMCRRVALGDERRRTALIDIGNLHTRRRQLARAEEQLCAAATAISEFGRNTIGRLLCAAFRYTHAWEAERSCAAVATNRIVACRSFDVVLRTRPSRSPRAPLVSTPNTEPTLARRSMCRPSRPSLRSGNSLAT
jgi:hypothetical protein